MWIDVTWRMLMPNIWDDIAFSSVLTRTWRRSRGLREDENEDADKYLNILIEAISGKIKRTAPQQGVCILPSFMPDEARRRILEESLNALAADSREHITEEERILLGKTLALLERFASLTQDEAAELRHILLGMNRDLIQRPRQKRDYPCRPLIF